jgi:hypothetical protein
MTTPSRRRSGAANPSTPGSGSVASRTSDGVPSHIKKLVAQELERRFPIHLCPKDTHSIHALLNTGTQALSKFLDELVAEDPVNNVGVGKRGDKIRDKIGDLVHTWKLKTKEDYRKLVIVRYGVIQVPSRKPRNVKGAGGDEEQSVASDLTPENTPAKKQPPARKQPPVRKPDTPPIKTVFASAGSDKKQAKMSGSSNCRLLSDGTLEGMKQRA